jgi:transposase
MTLQSIKRLQKSNMDTNRNGGYFSNGNPYDMSKKMEVLSAYFEEQRDEPADIAEAARIPKINVEAVAERARCSVGYAHKVITEYLMTGGIQDPKIATQQLARSRRLRAKIGPEESIFLLACRADDDQQTLVDYQRNLFEGTGVIVGTTTIHNFFQRRFEFKGNLRKAPLVPLDKWKPENITAFHTYVATVGGFPNHMKFHFIDEKHVVNKDTYNDRVRADPLTGRVRCIYVSGDFRTAFNLIGIIRCSGEEPSMHYSIGEENGTAASFLAYIEHLISIQWFAPGDVLVMDNAAIHTGGEAAIVSDLLWRVARVLVVPLPTRAPELNPIELVFHILARRLRAYKYRRENVRETNVPQQVERIVASISAETVLKCAAHCGY